LSLKPSSLSFLCCRSPYEESNVVILGCPLDLTASFRPGYRFAPNAIREASWNLESYSPLWERDLEEEKICDLGDLELAGTVREALGQIEEAVRELIGDGKRPLLLGGEHLITLGAVKALKGRYVDLVVLQVDAHGDLREEYLGAELSHATVMRRVWEEVGADSLLQVGVRSWDRTEAQWAREAGTFLGEGPEVTLPAELKERPLYLTLDLDVLDPGICPGVGSPEPGGWNFKELMAFLSRLPADRLVGADVVELSPPFDPMGGSAMVAAKVARELLLQLCKKFDI